MSDTLLREDPFFEIDFKSGRRDAAKCRYQNLRKASETGEVIFHYPRRKEGISLSALS
jgi:hypothetical protein